MARRRKYISISQTGAALAAIDSVYNLAGVNRQLNEFANGYRTAVGASGLPTQGVLGALVMAASGGIISGVGNSMLPNARIPLGKWGLKL